ncbi:TadG family pilus assembly protein [Cupriavidus agavae]|uniref:Putative membrane protein n=1 Tax=Cupriavidus agavae TaxID=1001822 RepID=A0A4Q7R8X0_9BURK|nr:TadG family pilus assembly protein [Cupriavidus agavae]RZT29345.1 putative membrane protein [Cupriavidus agavae]
MASPATFTRERGAVSLMAAVLIATVALGALVSIDIGLVFYNQRQLQKVADLAALSGAQQLKRADDLATTAANVAASVSAAASQNGYGDAVSTNCAEVAAGAADGLRACLGLWDPANPANGDSVRHFNPAYNPATVSPNAVRVQVTRTVPLLFVLPGGKSRQLSAEAIAAGSPPVASFSLGSGLVDFSSASSVLGLLLGNNVSLSVADWNGLASANVTLGDLRLQLGAGTVDQLLNTALSIQDFYALVLNAAGRQALLGAALGSPPTQLGVNGIGTRLTLSQLLDLGVLTPAASSAAEVGLNVASLLTAAAYVARGTDAVALNVPNLNVDLGLAKASATAALTVIQPPQVAVGPARQLPDGRWRTTASAAQLGINLRVNAALDLGALLRADVTLPVLVRAAPARADLTGLQCAAAPAQRRATVNVSTALLDVCLTDVNGRQCTPNPTAIARVYLLNAPVTGITAHPTAPNRAWQSSRELTLAPGTHAKVSSDSAVPGAVDALVNSLNPTLDVVGAKVPLGGLLDALLDPVLSLLRTVVDWLTATLGLSLANAEIKVNHIDCNNAEIVY